MINGQIGAATGLKSKRDAPGRLTVDEKRIWNKLIEDKPGEWFCEDNLVLLEQYCKLVMRLQGFIDLLTTATDIVAAGIFEDVKARKAALGELKLFNALVSVTTKDLNMVARNLRFTPHSRIDAKTAASGVGKTTRESEGRPWDTSSALSIAAQSSDLKKMSWDNIQ